MKNSIFEKLFFDEVGNKNLTQTEEKKLSLEKIITMETKLLNLLDEEQKQIFNDMENLISEMRNEKNIYNYREGFKLGLKIGIEINC